ncbi:MAG TPA: hypothetical protein VGL57_15550 [Solirubrobacteraceae bacterium]|jgi:hypothetical protein
MRGRAGNHVPELRDALVSAATRRVATDAAAGAVPVRAATLRARRTIRHARRVPLLAAVLAVALLSAAVALAATGLIQTGVPVKPLPGQRFTPTTGYGIPIATSVRLLPISVPDPAGGPPWGLRYLQTTRGLGCVEVGRVVGGRLGVLGRDGSFGNDGRFHELPADVFEPLDCAPLDGRRQAFIALTFHGRPASGGDRFGCLPAGGPEQRTPTCPQADERVVSFGLLGPDARSLSYRVGATTRTIPIAGPLGAYLLVQPLTAPRGQTLGWVTPLASPGASPFTKVGYAGGRVCHIPPADRVGGAHPCPLIGWVAPSAAHLTQAMVAARVRARLSPLGYGRHLVYRPKPLRARRLHLTFTARAGVSSAESRYLVELSPPNTGSCSRDMHAARLSPIERDVEVGEAVHVGLSLEPACPGRWSGSVIYVESTASGGPELFATMRAMLDLGGRVPTKGSRDWPLLVGHFSVVVR